MEKPTRIGEAITSYLKHSGLDVLLKNEKVCLAWQKVVGPEIASQTRIVGFKGGTLAVEVASSSLYAELNTYYLPSLVESLQRELKNRKVRKVKLRLGDFVEEPENGQKEKQS